MCRRAKLLVLILFALAGATLLLSGCHTMAGVGADVSQAGHAVKKAAEKHTH